MKIIPQDYLENITELGRELDVKITYGNVTLTAEDINKVSFINNSEFFKTIMNRVEIDVNEAIEKGTTLQVEFGLKIDGSYQYIDYGEYTTIEEPVYNADTRAYTVMAYDQMVEAMTSYDDMPVDLEFPVTHREFVVAIAENLGWTFNETDYPNADTEIDKDFYVSTQMTYRGVLDDLVVATMGNFIVKDGELKLKYPADTGIILNDYHLKDTKVDFGKTYGGVNSLVLSRGAEADNIFRQDEDLIEENGLHELKITDNMLLSREDRNNWIQEMFDFIKGFGYDIFDITTVGIGIFEPLDKVAIEHEGETYNIIITNNEFTISQGLEETMYTEEPLFSETDYKYADTEDRIMRKAQIIVDKQNLEITSITQKITETEDNLTTIQQNVDSLTLWKETQADLTRTVENGSNVTTGEASEYPILSFESYGGHRLIDNALYPATDLYPAADLYPKNNEIIRS